MAVAHFTRSKRHQRGRKSRQRQQQEQQHRNAQEPLSQLTKILLAGGKKQQKALLHSMEARIDSLVQEDAVIKRLQAELPARAVLTIPKARHWYDMAFQPHTSGPTYYINIKISSGGCDNAFNKKAIAYSLSSLPVDDIPNTMSFNKLYDLVKEHPRVRRDPSKEYYFLYIDKRDGRVFARSICDIKHWVSNPNNILQINWAKEKREQEKTARGRRHLMGTRHAMFTAIRASLERFYESCSRFLV